MKKLLLRTLFVAALLIFPQTTMAQLHVDVNIYVPPPIGFASPPRLVVLPETYIYVVPDATVDIFFYDGWWWRPWNGRWYRSRHYNNGWVYYKSVPYFYRHVPRDWRNDYWNHRWRKYRWNAEPLHYHDVQRNWRNWENDKHWERHNTWGVPELRNHPYYRRYQEPVPYYRQQNKIKYKDRDDHGHYGGHGHH